MQPTPGTLADTPTRRWFCAWNKQKQGPFTWQELQQFVENAKLLPTDMLLEEGDKKWLPASELDGLLSPHQPSGPQWYCAWDKSKAGPFDFVQLQKHKQTGRLQRTDMVLEAGSTRWARADSILNLFPPVPPQKTRQERFLEDLHYVYRIEKPRSQDDCVSHLGSQFDAWRSRRTTRMEKFAADLRHVFADFHGPDLDLLASRFDHLRQHKLKEMQTYLADLPADDPACSTISLFGTMDYGRLETAHTRTLAWLLDPGQPHGFGTRLLDELLRDLPDATPGLLEVEEARSEFTPSALWGLDPGRMDVFLRGTSTGTEEQTYHWVLAIEAKIDAAEGDNQLKNYDDWLRPFGQGKRLFRIFLTHDGRHASTNTEVWMPLSFLDLARIFRRTFPALRDKPGYPFLHLYLTGILKDICRWPLPLQPTTHFADPYGVVSYLKIVRELSTTEAKHGQPG